MSTQPDRCPYIFKDEFERQECEHPVYKDHSFCVFHSERIEEKANDFYKAFAKWIVLCTQKLDVIDLRGFVVPEMKLDEIIFENPVDFRAAQFMDNLLLQGVVFSQGADFGNARFHSQLVLRKSSYQDGLRFVNTEFDDEVNFANEDFESPVILTGARFFKNADFSGSTFHKNSDFRKAYFSAKANFNSTRFMQGGEFSEAVFADEVDFTKVKLDQSTDFRGTQFKGDALFAKARFSELASFWMATFGGNAVFRESFFAGNVIFWMCNFTGIADFRKTSFHQRAEFKGATFHNEIMLNESRLQFLKELDAMGVNMEGTILNASHFWGVSRLVQYSFQDAFLLSNNFTGKEFVECDFTGATFDSVHTKDWKLDAATISKTKYIFTEFVREAELDEYGQHRDIFHPREDSRIPAKGNFNEGVNQGFTLAGVFKQWTKKFVVMEIPATLHNAFIQYFTLFRQYGKVLFREDIMTNCFSEGGILRLELLAGDESSYETLDSRVSSFLKPVFTTGSDEFPKFADDPVSAVTAYGLHQAGHTLHASIAMILEQTGQAEQDDILAGLRRLIRDWALLSKETTDSDANLDAYLIEMFRVEAPVLSAPREETESVAATPSGNHEAAARTPRERNQPETPAAVWHTAPSIDVDTFIEVKFTLDDLEHALVQLRETDPQLGVKINGIQREITRVRDERDDESRLEEQQKRVTKIIQRTVTFLSAQELGNSEAYREAADACRKINEIFTT